MPLHFGGSFFSFFFLTRLTAFTFGLTSAGWTTCFLGSSGSLATRLRFMVGPKKARCGSGGGDDCIAADEDLSIIDT